MWGTGYGTGHGSPLVFVAQSLAGIEAGTPVRELDDHWGVERLGGFQNTIDGVGPYDIDSW